MRKISIVSMLFFGSISAMSQTLEDVNKFLDKKQYREAKTAVDAVIANPKQATKSDPWYFKARVYNALSLDPTTPPDEAYDLKIQTFESLKKYQALDPKDIRLKFENYQSYLEVYLGMFDLGAKYFNEKQYDKAFNSFKYALDAKDFMIAKNYTYTNITLYPLDTALVLNTAISAMQSKNEEQTVKYYRMLTDANVSGESYMEVYEYLADLYTKREDKENQQAMIEKGKQLYPNNDYWYLLELDAMRDKADQSTMFAKYEEVMAKNPKNYVVPYNYSIEMYNAIWGRDSKGGDQTAMKEKLTATLKLAVENDKGIDATVLLSKHLYNLSSDLSIAANIVKGTKPEDVKKKADLVAKTNQQMDEFLIYADKASVYLDAQPKLKGAQKGSYNEMMASMIEVYTYKKNPTKAAEIQKKKDALDN